MFKSHQLCYGFKLLEHNSLLLWVETTNEMHQEQDSRVDKKLLIQYCVIEGRTCSDRLVLNRGRTRNHNVCWKMTTWKLNNCWSSPRPALWSSITFQFIQMISLSLSVVSKKVGLWTVQWDQNELDSGTEWFISKAILSNSLDPQLF